MHFIKLLTANKHHDQRSILCFFFHYYMITLHLKLNGKEIHHC